MTTFESQPKLPNTNLDQNSDPEKQDLMTRGRNFLKTTPGKVVMGGVIVGSLFLGKDHIVPSNETPETTTSTIVEGQQIDLRMMSPSNFYELDQPTQDMYNYTTRMGKDFEHGVTELNRGLEIAGLTKVENPGVLATVGESDQATLDRTSIYDYLASSNTFLDPFQVSDSPEAQKNLSFYIEEESPALKPMYNRMGDGTGPIGNSYQSVGGSGVFTEDGLNYKIVAAESSSTGDTYQVLYQFKEFEEGGVWVIDKPLRSSDPEYIDSIS